MFCFCIHVIEINGNKNDFCTTYKDIISHNLYRYERHTVSALSSSIKNSLVSACITCIKSVRRAHFKNIIDIQKVAVAATAAAAASHSTYLLPTAKSFHSSFFYLFRHGLGVFILRINFKSFWLLLVLFVVGIFGLNEWHKAINFVSKTRLYRFHYIDMQKATEKKKQQAKKWQ